MVVEGRFHELETYSNLNPKNPTLEAAADSASWSWRFVAALATRMLADDADRLIAAIGDAERPEERTAATVAAAAALLGSGHVHDAVQLLADALEKDDAAPVDDAWLRIQHARACIELDDLEKARAAVAQAQRIRYTHPDDVTATAIVSIASLLTFRLADWGHGQLQDAIAGADTLAVWWRSSSVATGASAALNAQLDSWSRYPTAVIFDDKSAHNTLVTTAVLSSHLGDHSAWQNLEALTLSAQILQTDRDADPDQVRDLVSGLHNCGADRQLGRVVHRYVQDGPAAGVRSAAAGIDLRQPTRSTLMATLALLRSGGDVLDAETASNAVDWISGAIDNPAALVPASRWGGGLAFDLIDTLARLTRSAERSKINGIADRILALPPADRPGFCHQLEPRGVGRSGARLDSGESREGSGRCPLAPSLASARAVSRRG
ncbi:tetratricopeptide repeat protein [Amycolatopsis tolypomycina]|uniref:tetratricopeptide repeat protein n=1 Tax=Amycolatopsis tolypomycina TaxID=208445 RepID=UPI00115F78C2|nr:tetratricopeptide repeat protein [Amycolatopsis tolypomycina]